MVSWFRIYLLVPMCESSIQVEPSHHLFLEKTPLLAAGSCRNIVNTNLPGFQPRVHYFLAARVSCQPTLQRIAYSTSHTAPAWRPSDRSWWWPHYFWQPPRDYRCRLFLNFTERLSNLFLRPNTKLLRAQPVSPCANKRHRTGALEECKREVIKSSKN